MKTKEHVVITVMGQDRVGIVANVSKVLADCQANIIDISQTILQDIFAMILMVDISEANKDLIELQELLAQTGKDLGVNIVVQHEDIFRYMHRI
ncbi:MAG TPA: ACT domain-containing protein [Bacillota bacterium]|jgi:ACT domain-containing protein|nr:ACT domain-containing protein [Bacillota bacterium]HOL08627.1 ACT domain-containing protein [Bacillota bacterium]HPO96671.1 ACT domain-containing protein [Bacillota bacterium]